MGRGQYQISVLIVSRVHNVRLRSTNEKIDVKRRSQLLQVCTQDFQISFWHVVLGDTVNYCVFLSMLAIVLYLYLCQNTLFVQVCLTTYLILLWILWESLYCVITRNSVTVAGFERHSWCLRWWGSCRTNRLWKSVSDKTKCIGVCMRTFL